MADSLKEKEVAAPEAGIVHWTTSRGVEHSIALGERIEEGEFLCQVEVMKTFVPINTPCSGTMHSMVANGYHAKRGEIICTITPIT